MSYPTRLLQGVAIAAIGIVAVTFVLVTSVLAEANIPPVAVDDAAGTVQDTPVTIDVLANDSDSDGGTLSVAPGALARAAIVAANPVLFWECYPVGGGTAVDRSGNGNDGAITGAVTAGDLDGDCDGDNAFLFPVGSGASVTQGTAAPVGASPRTFVVRFQAGTELAGGTPIFGTGTTDIDSAQFSISRDWDNGQLLFTGFANDHFLPLPGGTNLGDGNEYTIAVVYDGVTTVTAYVNGVAGTPTTIGQLDTVGGNVSLGTAPWTSANAGDQLRQFAIFDTALDAGTIASIHAAIDSAAAGQAFSDPANGSLTNNGTDVTYTPDPGFFGVDTFTYSVSDGQGGSASATVTVTVSGVAGAQPDDVTVTTGEVLTFDAVANDVIPEGLTASITSVATPGNGTAVILDDTTIEYTPNPGFVGTDTFTYTLTTEPGGETSQALVSVIVTPANQAPVALDDTSTTTMGKPVHIDVIANDSDPDGNDVYVSPGQLARSAILRAGPLLHWECLPESLPTTLHDTSGNGRDGEVGAGVTPGTETGDCDNGTSMSFAGIDGLVTRDNPGLPVGQEARSALVRYKANFTTEPADIPLFGYGQNGTPYAQFTVSRTILGNDKLIFTSWANDLHFDLPPGSNIADGNEHNIMFVYDGDVTVYAYYDGIPSGQGTLAVPLNTIDDTVMLGASPWGWRSNGDELRQFAIFPNAISEDDAYLVHAAIEAAVQNKSYTDPRFGTIVEDANHLGFTYTPDPGYVGPDQFYYSISDGHGGGSFALVTLDVLPGVSALNDTAFTPVDTAVTIDVLGNDTAQPGAVLTIDSVTQPPFGTVTTNGTTLEFTPQAGWLGIATFTYTVSSDIGGDDTASVSINVGGTGDNFPPTAIDDSATTSENTPVTINVLANDSDPDNDGISVSQGESAIPGINAYNPSLYWACLPAAGSSTLFDQSGNGVDGTINGSVTPGALADDCGGGTTMVFPNAAAYVGRTFPGLPQGAAARTVVLRYRTDISDPSTIGMFGFGTNGVGNQQFSVSRNLTGNANLSFTAWGNDTVIELPVSIADGLEHTIAIVYDGATTITGYVDGVAGTPATLFAPLNTVDSEVILGRTLWGAVGDAAEMRHFAVFDGALSGTDIADIHNIIESVVHDPAYTQGTNGSVTQTAFDSLEYTPSNGFVGVDTFTYTVSDGNGGESTATVTVTVEAAPLLDLTAVNDTATTVGTDPVSVDVLANDIADPTATLVIDSVTTPDNGTATISGNSVTYTANPNFDGLDSFFYTVSDGLGNTKTAQVNVTVIEAPNQPPVAVDDTATTALNTATQIDVLANDSDPDLGDVLSLGASAVNTLNGFAPSLYWACLPASGTTVPDESGNGNDGTIQGNVIAGAVAGDCGGATPVFADGSALIFNSAPGSVPVGSSARTIVVRFRSDLSTPADVGLFGYGTNAVALGQFSIARSSTGNDRLTYAMWGGDGVVMFPAGSNIGDGNEHTIGLVYDGANSLTAYFDGVAGPSVAVPTLDTVNGQVMLGQTLYGAISAGAEMRHFAIYPSILSSLDMQAIHATIEAGSAPIFTQPANGTVTRVGGQLEYTPNEDFSGDDVFTYTVSDGNGGSATATVTVTVLGNQPPVAVDDAVATNQGQNITIDVMANDSDPENDVLSFTPSLNAISTLNGYAPALYWACLPDSGSTVPDQSGNGNDGTIQGNVVAGPLAGDCGGATPIFADGTALILNNLPSTLPLGSAARTIVVRYRTDLATPANVGLLGYGANAAPLGQFSIARTSAGNDRLLFASWGGDNILHLAPGTNIADGAEHTIVITYDGANTITAWVDGVAGTPATIPVLDTQNSVAMLGQTLYGAVSAGASMRHFAIYNGVLSGAAIAEIHSAIAAGGATAWTQPANGFVSQDGNSLVYDPNVGFVGTDSFTYVIQDEDGHISDPATVTVTVSAVALAPEDDTAFTQQDTPVEVSVLDNDAGADLQISGVTNGANGTVTTNGTTVTYTPAPGFFGTDTFTVDVTDGLNTVTTTTTVTVNGAPTGPNQTVETESEVPVTVTIIPPVTDPEDDALTIISTGPASNGSVTIDGNDVTYTSEPGFDGTDSFDVTVEDENGGTVTVTVTVIVTNNNAPIAVDDTATTNSPLPITIDVLGNDSDPDLDPIQFASAITQMNSYAPSLYWTCLPETGSTVPDESGNGNDGTIQGNVVAGPIADDCGGATPVFADGSALIFNSTPGSVPVGSDARTVVVRFRSDLATPSDVGLFGYGTNATGLGQFSVVRTAAGNDRLWFETWGMGALLMLPPGSDVADGNEHTIAIVYDGGTTITAYFDGVAGTPATLFTALNTVNGQVMLGQTLYGAVSAGASMRHFAIYDGTLTGANISAIHAAIEAGGSLSYTQGSDGIVSRSGDQLVYTPNAGFIGTDSFTYTITDGKETATATVTVTVDPPLLEAVDDSAFTQQDTPVTVSVLDNDEGDDLVVTGTTNGANGTVTTDGTTVTYTPAPGFYGTDTFTVDVTDGITSDTSTVTVTVNGAPTGPDLDDETLPATPVTITVVPPVTDPEDGTSITITGTSTPSNGSVVISGGDVTYTPAPGFVGTDTFEVTVEDNDGGSVTITVTVVVNTPLVVNDDTAFTQQDTPVTIDVLANDEGDAPTIVGTSNGANGTVTNNGTDVTYTPAPGFWGTDTFTVMVQDGDEIASSTVTVTVNGAPAGPDLDDETPPATPITVAVVPPVSDPESGSLAITSAGPASNGTVDIDGSSVVYTPAPGFVGTDTFPVTIADEDGGSTTITVTIVVNTELVANDDTAFTQQDTAVTVDVLANDVGDTLVVAGASNGANGTVANNGTDVTYTPDAGFWGTDTFTVMVQDGSEIASSTVTVTVNGTPTGPDLDEETLPETPVTISVVPPVTDPEAGPLTITGTSTPANGSVVIDGDDVVYTPAPGFFGTDTFTVTVADADGGSVTITVTVLVNTPLVANDDSAFTQQDTPVTVAVLDNDEGDSPAVDSATDGTNGTVTTDGTTVTYTPNPGYFGIDTFTVTIVDGDETATSTVTVTVNGAPVGDDIDDETTPETPVTISIVPPVTDPEDGPLTITSAGPAGNGTVTIDDGDVVYTPEPGFIGIDTFTVTIEDEDGGTVTITVTVTVDTPLEVEDDSAFTQQDTPVTVSVLDNDSGDDLGVDAVTDGANGTVTTNGTTVTYTPAPGFFGTDTFTVTVVDNLVTGETATSTVTVTVNGAPTGPDIDDITEPETPVTISIVPPVTDPEAGELTITDAGPAGHGTVTINGGTVVYTPEPGFLGTDTFEVTIEDEDGGSVTITVTVLVHVALVANDDSGFTQQDTPITVSVLDNDLGDDLSVIGTGTAANGTVTTDGTTVTYTPNPGFWGTDTFTVTIEDAIGGEPTATSTVTITVNGAPTGPDIDAGTIPFTTPVTVGIIPPVTDPENTNLTITNAGPASNGTVTIDGDTVIYTPNPGFTGPDTFEVTVEDEDGGSVTITVTVNVNTPPAATDVELSTQQGVGVGFDSGSSVTDPDGDDVEIINVTTPSNGTVTTVGTSITYTPNPGFAGTDTFEVTVEDEYGDTATFTVTVEVNGPPVADDIAVETSEDVAIDIDVLAGATDPNGDDLEVSTVTTPSNGTVSVLNGVATYTPGSGFTGTDSFDVTIEDGNDGSVTITVTVTVSGAPRIVLVNNACLALVTQASESGHLSEFWIEAPGTPSFLGIVDDSPVGTEVVLGTYPAGTEIVLSIHVTNTGHVFQTGAGYNNPDGLVHVQLTPGTGNVLYTVGFEDLYNGGDLDFNDAVVDLLAVDCDVTATDDAATTDEDVAVTIDALDNDTTSYGTLAVTDVTDPANGTVTESAGVFTYTPDAGFSGTDTFTYTVENGLGGTDTATVTVTVTPAPRVILANNACVALVFAGSETANNVQLWLNAPGTPTLLGDNSNVGAEYPLNTYTAGTELELSITVTNYGWVFHTGSAASNPDGITHAQVTPGTGNVLFVVGFEDTLNGGDLDFNDIVVNVVEIDCGVDAVDDSAETEEDVAIDIDALDNDSTDYGTLAITDVTDPANGTVTELNGVFTYTPANGFYGTDTFTYTVENGMGGTDTATVTVTVLAAPRIILAANACVIAEVQQHGVVTYTNQFWLEAPGAPQYLGIDNWDIGEQATLGYFEAGTELVVSIHVTNTGHVFQSGPAYNNPDNFVHVIVTPGTGDVLYTVAFEDLFNGGDQDYNDAIVNLIEVPCDVAAEDDSAFTQQDTAVTVDVLDNDSGVELEVTSVTQGANGSVTTDGTTATYTPDAGFYGTDTFTYTASNGLGSPDTATVTVTVNGAPLGDDLEDTTAPETPVSIPVIPTVTDPEGGELTITSAGPASNGTATIDGDNVVYTPNAGFIGTDSFEVTIEDEDGGTLTITVTVDVNTPLVANDDTAFTQQETPVTVAVLDNDEGDAPTVSTVTNGANGTATTNGTTVTYTPNAGFFGTDTVTVTVVDGSETQTSTLTVTVNGAPTGPDIDGGVTQIDTPITVGIIPPVSDPEGGPLTITSAGPGSNGTVTIDGDDVVYTPNPGYTGPDSFQVTIEDEDGGSVTITVTVYVNAPPTATDVELSTIEGVGVGFATGSVIIEPDGDDVTIVDLGTPANGTVTTDGSSITYLPNPGFSGTDSFLVTIEDTYGAQATFTVTVDVNGAPQGDDIAVETEEDVAVDIDVLAGITDPEGDDLSVVDVAAPANGTTSIVGGVVTYTPAAGFFGTDSFEVTIEDEVGNSVTITVTVTVNAAPRVILAADACVAVVAQGGEAGYTNNFWLEAPGVPTFLGITNRSTIGTTVPLGTFAAGTELEFAIHVVDTGHVFQTGPAYNNPDNLVHVTVAPGTGDVLYTVGFEDLLNGGDLDFNDAVVDVIAIDCGVDAVDDSATTQQGASVDIAVLDNDSTENGTLDVTGVTAPANGVVTEANGVLTYSPNTGFSGTDTFTYTVVNGLGGSDTATVTVEVQAAQMVVLAEDACIAIRVEQHGVVTYTNNIWLESPGAPQDLGIDNWDVGDQVTLGNYAAGTELILSIHVQNTGHVYQTGPASRNPDNFMHAHVTPGTGNVLYLVEFEDLYNGGDQDFNDAIFSVLSINCDLTAVDDGAQTDKNDDVRIYVLGNDSSSAGGLRIVGVSNPPHGDADIKSNGTYIKYDPDHNFQGVDTFTYTVRDAAGQEATATVTVQVGHINLAPEANDDTATTPKGNTVYVSVLDNDTDPDNDDLDLKSVSPIPASQGQVTISGDRVKLVPNANFTGTITFTYTVEDEDGLTDTATVTVTVTQPAGITSGKMTGGGSVRYRNENSNWGMEFRCSTGTGHFNFHDESVRLHMNNVVFDSMTCVDNPSINNGRNFDTVVLVGHDNSASVYNYTMKLLVTATIVDRGGNGSNDTMTIKVTTESGYVVTEFSMNLAGGNHEAHNNN